MKLRMDRQEYVKGKQLLASWLEKIKAIPSKIYHYNLEPVYRFLLKRLIHLIYSIDTTGFEKLPKEGAALIICNHISYMDGVLISACIDRPVRYIIDKNIYQAPIVHYFMRQNRGIPIAPNKHDVGHALDLISEGLENGDMICVFPEGQLTYTGNLGRFRPGIEWMVKRDPVTVYPMALKGLWGSIFSRKYRKAKFRFVPRSFRRKVSLICGEPIAPENVKIDDLQKIVMRLRDKI